MATTFAAPIVNPSKAAVHIPIHTKGNVSSSLAKGNSSSTLSSEKIQGKETVNSTELAAIVRPNFSVESSTLSKPYWQKTTSLPPRTSTKHVVSSTSGFSSFPSTTTSNYEKSLTVVRGFPTENKSTTQVSLITATTDISAVLNDSNLKPTCEAYFAAGRNESGVYPLELPQVGKFKAFCDMENGGGWTVIQKRLGPEVYFANRTWDEYNDGFGDVSSSHWLGLSKIYGIVQHHKGRPLVLRIEINGDWCKEDARCSGKPSGFWWGEWHFKISSSKRNYELTVSPAVAGNLTQHTSMDVFHYMNNRKPFTTIDRDNDRFAGNCAQFRDYGGWWHNDCGYVALNGKYGDTSSKMRNAFWLFKSDSWPIVSYYIKPKSTKMMLRSKL
ncbi:hypothetical protein AB6A40_009422 [Gnathostoma spinigerum]|uniref:Fibrinogen C-terminal domain-containing protein n=1 Tax=Gnathostoma spinigerum TaxID=75299 RepID=A0ABD6ESC4_9BILA